MSIMVKTIKFPLPQENGKNHLPAWLFINLTKKATWSICYCEYKNFLYRGLLMKARVKKKKELSYGHARDSHL